jgi:hypothetical protein
VIDVRKMSLQQLSSTKLIEKEKNLKKLIIIGISVVLLIVAVVTPAVLAGKPSAGKTVLMDVGTGYISLQPMSGNFTDTIIYPGIRHVSLTLGIGYAGTPSNYNNSILVDTANGLVVQRVNWNPNTDPVLVTVEFDTDMWLVSATQVSNTTMGVGWTYTVTYPSP